MRTSLITLLLAFLFVQVNAQLSTQKLFADHMVLQRNQPIPVWGWTSKKGRVTVMLNGQSVTAKADDQGNWKAILQPMKEGGPYIMQIASGDNLLTYKDVMIGEVWICSGQSNMEFQLKNALGYKAEQKIAAQIPIRQFKVTDKVSITPEKDVSGGQWAKADTILLAILPRWAIFFAKKLSQTLHVTVGLIYQQLGRHTGGELDKSRCYAGLTRDG